MGFFSNLKNSLTGGWATVTLTAGDGVRGARIPVRVDVQVKDSPIKVAKVYLHLECQEEIEIPSYSVDIPNVGSTGNSSTQRTIRVHQTHTQFQRELVLATPGEIGANQTVSFQGEVEIPADQVPTSRGRYYQTYWRVMAGLDMSGNDPDSGWVTIIVR